MNDLGIRVSKRCPECGWRVLEKVTPTTGCIQIKCPRCKKEVKIDLSLRMNLQVSRAYR